MITKLTPNLIVPDVDAATPFYERLGFRRVVRVPEEGGSGDFAILVTGAGVELMLQSRDSIHEDLPPLYSEPYGGGVILYLAVDDAKGLHDELAPDVDVIVGLRQTWYGATEFYIRDPNGYAIGFAEHGTEQT